jgi:hypothetical protein
LPAGPWSYNARLGRLTRDDVAARMLVAKLSRKKAAPPH